MVKSDLSTHIGINQSLSTTSIYYGRPA